MSRCAPYPEAKGIDARAVDLRDRQAVAEALTGVQRVFLATPLEEDMAAVAARVSAQVSELLGRPPIAFRQFAAEHADAFR